LPKIGSNIADYQGRAAKVSLVNINDSVVRHKKRVVSNSYCSDSAMIPMLMEQRILGKYMGYETGFHVAIHVCQSCFNADLHNIKY
jgi:glyceraldehyde-3-phosphate dehydrogenase/erythrose-4-phosphate dehydrogenase